MGTDQQVKIWVTSKYQFLPKTTSTRPTCSVFIRTGCKEQLTSRTYRGYLKSPKHKLSQSQS